MNIRRRFAGVLSLVVILAMVMPLTVLADSDEEYIVEMTSEEVSAILLAEGVNLDKGVSVCASLGDKNYLNIGSEKSSNRIAVTYYTEASIVANEIGIKNLYLYESKILGWTDVVSDYKDYYGFKQSYYGGFYYMAPESGKKYYAEGNNYAILTTTTYTDKNTSRTITY